MIFTGFLFIPLERIFARDKKQPVFREEWREDLFYYLISSLLVQVLTFLSMTPAIALTAHTHWTAFRGWVASQPVILQIVEIMFFTDLVQYWVHRAFHRVPFLWGFHAVHHSAKSLDWMAGARMHFLEIICLRGTTVIPMYLLGFSPLALHAYILLVYVHSSLVHANIGWNFDHLGRFLVTPRFHHWHHGIDKEAIDVNFAIHFPLLDRLFGTYHMPRNMRGRRVTGLRTIRFPGAIGSSFGIRFPGSDEAAGGVHRNGAPGCKQKLFFRPVIILPPRRSRFSAARDRASARPHTRWRSLR